MNCPLASAAFSVGVPEGVPTFWGIFERLARCRLLLRKNGTPTEEEKMSGTKVTEIFNLVIQLKDVDNLFTV